MKKGAKSCLLIVLGGVVLIVLGVVLMFVLHICPPSGPWPMPPWCAAGSTDRPGDSASFDGPALLATAVGAISNADQYPVENTWGYVTPTPTVAPGTAISLDFMVALPQVAQGAEVTLHANGSTYAMHSEDGQLFSSDALLFAAGEAVSYYYSSGQHQTAEESITPQSDFTVRDGLNWLDTDPIAMPGFIKGFGMMDFGGFNVLELRGGRLPSTLDSMKRDGAEWYFYDYYWAYRDYTIPEMVDESQYPNMLYPTAEDFKRMADEVHQSGLKFGMLLSLEWSAIPGTPCYDLHDDADKLAECSNNYWLEGRQYEVDMLHRLEANPQDSEALAYRDRWFEQYGNYLNYVAQVAEENHIEMLVLGKLAAFSHSPLHAEKWQELIAAVRSVYHGQLALIYECYDDACLTTQPWIADMDLAVVYYWFRISDADDPSRQELAASFERINREVIAPFYQQYHKPVALITPFMSRDHPARQDWVEPASSAPEVGRDLMGQAELYELLFDACMDQQWFSGVIPYGYWFFDGFHQDFAFDRSYNVRGKPAGLVLRSWFERIDASGVN
jgi:hypothetical protein